MAAARQAAGGKVSRAHDSDSGYFGHFGFLLFRFGPMDPPGMRPIFYLAPDVCRNQLIPSGSRFGIALFPP